MNFSEFQQQFNPSMEACVRDRAKAAQRVCSLGQINVLISHMIALTQSGKRVRPYIAYLGYVLAGGKDQGLINRMGVSIELFHTFCLIHDDIIDQATTRRHTPTLQTVAAKSYDTPHISNSQALLVGDLVFDWARDVLFEVTQAYPDRAKSIWQEQSGMVQDVVVGQMIDVDLMTRTAASVAEIDQKMELKTASYTFVRPMRMGMQLAGGSDELLLFAGKFGKQLGLAFQNQDDLLDISGSKSTVGKDVCNDIEEGQQTIFTHYVFEKGNEEDKALLKEALGMPLTEEQRQKIKAMFIRSGAVDYGKGLIGQQITEAKKLLSNAPITEAKRAYLTDFIEQLSNRTA